ncbi:hypothetical protein CMV_020710 [Castanea mollissima]|uniref:Uncharacterized protein n=1 Tax=Castanea mollissima TaxID=60419 RepID=A0A8J4VDC7_9ROSI|nr:hypothetical protein CMV_020710 [Castanea mollissima]
MISLELLHLTETGICELPPSFGNLTRIIQLLLGNSAGQLHLPSSIYNLLRLEVLCLFGDFTFLKDEEPLCNSYGGFSKYVFRSLNHLNFWGNSKPSTKCKICICTKKRNTCSDLRNDRASTKSATMFRLQSSLRKLFEDLNLGEWNLVQVFCETFNDTRKFALVITRLKPIANVQRSLAPHIQQDQFGYLDSRIISSAMDGGGSSSISLTSNSGLSMDVTNGSEFDFGFQSTLGDGFDMVKENETLLIKFHKKHCKGWQWHTMEDH